MQQKETAAPPVSLWSIYKLFFLVGAMSFGGGVTAWFHREVVLVRGWMTDDQFFSGYSLAQVLPGVNSTNMAVYIGQHVRGAIGATVALIAMMTGPFAIVIAAAMAYHWLVALPGFSAAMAGIATAAVGMIFRMGLTSGQPSLRHLPSALVLVATFLAVGVFQWPLVLVVLVLAPVSIAASWWIGRTAKETGRETPSDAADGHP